MRKTAILLISGLCLILLAAGCAKSSAPWIDGVYTAEVRNYDSYGYKDYLVVTISGGAITDLVFSSRAEDGSSIMDDEKYKTQMEAVTDTFPQKYAKDLVNQLLQSGDINQVQAVAGATYSSNSFKALFTALEKNMQTGDTTLVVIDNVSES